MPHSRLLLRRRLLATAGLGLLSRPVLAQSALRLVVADQNQVLQTMLPLAGEQAKLPFGVTYANFQGGPAILEAFRAGALDVAVIGNTPPIQAHAAGERLPVIAARLSSRPDYQFALRPGLRLATLAEFRGKRIAYAEGTARQPFVLAALKKAGLSRRDVRLVPLRVADFVDALRSNQVDVGALNEPHYSRYLAEAAERGISTVPEAELDGLPRRIAYLYASGTALAQPAKYAALRDFVRAWVIASRWIQANNPAWVEAYYVRQQRLRREDGEAAERSEGSFRFPPLGEMVPIQQELIDLIHAAGDLPRRLDAGEEFDRRFDDVIAAAVAA
ncbi:ABC transporter substrate-binding protein [Paracraurococcus lichenis]|uniref:ABC transporter substrate-binding protein n=1 Tax=Paracraurococcus lichenis TaxID=3064888 RepID=A0ABT9E5N1_9PROT|nr:ABC transporter substrate-binding protein [Paracraurococcus sp. LOR1-02]MDO9711468.1 ABC transporter substrate-binding protein [Paracraurococcus sp. LOR1-02]